MGCVRMMKHWVGIIIRSLFVSIAILSLLCLIHLSIRYALTLLIACALALSLSPVLNFLSKKLAVPREFSALILLLLLFSLFISFLLFLTRAVNRDIFSLTRSIPNQISAQITGFQNHFFMKIWPFWEQNLPFSFKLSENQEKNMQQNLANMTDTAAHFMNTTITQIVTSLNQLTRSLSELMLSSALIFLVSFLIVNYTERIKNVSKYFVNPELRQPLKHIGEAWFDMWCRMIRRQIVPAVLSIPLVYLVLLILRTEYAFVIALIAGLAGLIPYLGSAILFIPWILFRFLSHRLISGLVLSALYLTLIIQKQLSEPKKFDQSIRPDPFFYLISLYLGFRWLGFAGLIVGPLLLIALKTLYRDGTLRKIWYFISKGNGDSAPHSR